MALNKNYYIETDRKIELENWLSISYPNGCNGYRNLENFLEYYNTNESDYLLDACLVPRGYVENIIRYYNIYDENEISNYKDLIEELANKFEVSTYDIIKRIKDVLNIIICEGEKKITKIRKSSKIVV